MRNKLAKYFTLLIPIFLFTENIMGQQHQIGLSIGNGRVVINTDGDWRGLGNPIGNKNEKFYCLGIDYYYTPKKSIFGIKTGLSYDYRYSYEEKYTYLRLPIGLDFTFSRGKLKPVIGFGIYTSYLIVYQVNLYNQEDFLDTKNNFQVGWKLDIGIEYEVNKKLGLFFLYANNFDVTKMYEKSRTKGGVSTTITPISGNENYFSIGVKFKLSSYEE